MVKEGEEFCKATVLIKKESMDKIEEEYKDKLVSSIIFDTLQHRGLDVCEVETEKVVAKVIPEQISYEGGNGYITTKDNFHKNKLTGEKQNE